MHAPGAGTDEPSGCSPATRRLTRQPQDPLAGDVAQDLRRTARDRQAAGVEQLPDVLAQLLGRGDESVALELDDELGAVLTVADAEQLGHRRLRTWPLAGERTQRRADAQQRAHRGQGHGPPDTGPLGL